MPIEAATGSRTSGCATRREPCSDGHRRRERVARLLPDLPVYLQLVPGLELDHRLLERAAEVSAGDDSEAGPLARLVGLEPGLHVSLELLLGGMVVASLEDRGRRGRLSRAQRRRELGAGGPVHLAALGEVLAGLEELHRILERRPEEVAVDDVEPLP